MLMENRSRTLLIGYGNPFRRDDGVAYHIINDVRLRIGREPLARDEDGQDSLGADVDTLMLHQLLPELAPLLADYAQVIFVDAHTGAIEEDIRVAAVEEEYGFQAVTHHMSPGMMLRLAREVAGRAPAGWLVSVRGVDFDFGDDLSESCAACAAQAAGRIMELVEGKSQ